MSHPLALVTGASGFLGRRLLPNLVRRGYRVRGLFRSPEQAEAARAAGYEAAVGDVTQPRTLPDACRGVTHVFHLAGLLRGTKAQYLQVNRDGTRNVAAAVRATAPDLVRFVLVSSRAAVGPSRDGGPLTERTPPRPACDYGRSKLAGEQMLAEFPDLPSCAIRPPLLYGPGDRLGLPLFRLASRGFTPRFVGGLQRMGMLHVADAARAVTLAGRAKGLDGRRILVTGPDTVTPELLRRAFEIAFSRRVRLLPLPAAPIARLARFLSPLIGERVAVELSFPRQDADPAEAARALGFEGEIALAYGIAETAAWYREHGWLQQAVG